MTPRLPKHSVSVAAAIFDRSGEHVLLVKRRDNGRWEPPGGVLERNETIEEGLRREVREETGAEINVGQLTGVYKNMELAVVAMVFRCHIQSEPLSSSPEAEDIQWHCLGELQGKVHESFLIRLLDAAQDLPTAVRSLSSTPP